MVKITIMRPSAIITGARAAQMRRERALLLAWRRARAPHPSEEDVAYGYTFAGWLRAADRSDSASEYDLRAAWRAGELPAEYSLSAQLRGRKITPLD